MKVETGSKKLRLSGDKFVCVCVCVCVRAFETNEDFNMCND